MAHISKRALILAGTIYFAALGIAQAQGLSALDTHNEGGALMVCVDRAKEAARKSYGNCLADQKTIEMQELRKAYAASLQDMQKKHQQELAELRTERAQLRKGIIEARKKQIEEQESILAKESASTEAVNLNEDSMGMGSMNNRSGSDLNLEQDQVVVQKQTISEPKVQLKSATGSKAIVRENIEISPMQNGNSVDLPEPEVIQ